MMATHAMVIGSHLTDGGRPQRGHSNRPGVVGVVLVDIPSSQQPDPRAELGLDIQDPLTGGQQLLGHQVAGATRPSTAQVRCGQAASKASSRSA